MGWNISEDEKALKVDIDGRLVAAVAPSLREEVLGMMKDGTNVLFDLSGMVHIDSSGLGVLVQILQKAKAGGTGLGLSICRKLAKAMGGEMKVSSVLGKGTTFAIVVPGVREAGSGGADGTTETTGTNGTGDSRPAPTVSPVLSVASVPVVPASPRILIADDTKMNQIVLKTMFAKLGVKDMTFANNGREALDILRDPESPPFDLVLTDLFMPEMTGEELVAEIRADPSLAANRVYLFTAEVEMKDTYAEKGFDGILLKPANLEALKNILP